MKPVHHGAHGLRPTTLALAMMLIGAGTLALAPHHAYAQQAPLAAKRSYAIAAGPLGDVLAEFAAIAGVRLVFDPATFAGVRSAGLQGEHGIADGFALLLQHSGYRAMPGNGNGNGNADHHDYVLVANPVAGPQGGAPVSTLAAVTVVSDAADDPVSYTRRTVSIGKSEQALKDIPQSVSVVTRQRMDDQNLTSLYDVLENVTGVVTTQSPMAGKYFFSRGFPITSLQYDGVPLTRQFYSQASSLTENMALFDRAEVLRGSAGLWQGADSLGGAVNLVRKRGQHEKTMELTARAGSHDLYGAQLDAGGPLNERGTVRGRAVIDHDRRNSFIDFVGSSNLTVYGAIDIDITPSTTAGFGISHESTDATPSFAGLPRYADGGDLGLRRGTFLGADWNDLSNRQTRVFADLAHRFGNDWRLKVGAVYMDEHNTSLYSYGQSNIVRATGAGATRVGVATDFAGEHAGVDAALNGKFTAWGRTHEVIVGANYSRYTSDDRYAIAAAGLGTVDVFNPDPYQRRFDLDSLAAMSGGVSTGAYTVTSKGLYGTARFALSDRLHLTLGGRTSWYSNKYASVTRWGADTSLTRSRGEFTPYAGLTYAITPDWTGYGSYAEVFVPQAGRTVAQTTLAPITGRNYELGVKGQLFAQRVNASLALFRYLQNNRAVPDIDGGLLCDGDYCSRAAGKVRSQGLEAEAGGKITASLNLSAGYTYNMTTYLRDATNEGKIFNPQVPRHLLRVWTDQQLGAALSVGLGLTAQSGIEGRAETVTQGGYALWNARAAYRLDRRWTLALNVNNLADRRYYATIDRTNFGAVYGNPRELVLTLRGLL